MGKTKRRSSSSSSSSSQSSSSSSTDDGRRHRRRVKRLRKELKFKNKFLEKQPMLIFLGLRTDTAAGWPNVMNLQTRHTFLMRHWYYRVAKGQGMRAVVSDERGAGRGERKKGEERGFYDRCARYFWGEYFGEKNRVHDY
ncbi:unnamed protein product [Acanthoscelides obtectus]|uniref:Uncharacterized protein n=1 Tax=Acanthoscelides obtectus TaxID=200917 RepID=A0A9P0LGU9_ACAOB|nr:unnamed protein product [Acanthoscelides obtectus]CAK1623186.1 hypothetical protein AOBTE_LOCUS1868 [Acanthoscelides obtectus]